MRIFFTSTVHCFGRFFGRSFELLGHQTIGTSHYWTVALYIKLSDYWAFGPSYYRTDTPRPLWWTLYSFFTYTNDLPEATTSRVRLFAYDGLLFSRIKSTEDATFVHNDLTSLGELERKWQICFHPEKCSHQCLRTTSTTPPDIPSPTWTHTWRNRLWEIPGTQHQQRSNPVKAYKQEHQ
jgi:hypothetical protein